MKVQNNIKLVKPYFENLDALRFIAAFSVFTFHFFQEIKLFIPFADDHKLYKVITSITSKGTLGVNFFFVLSGFLITYLILYEHQHTHRFSLTHFLIRRTLRIWPLYLFIVCLGFVIFPLLFKDYHTVHDPIYYLFFLANFDELAVGLNDSINFLTAPWSVAVEEQFYLFWGIMLSLLLPLKRFKVKYLIGTLLIVSWVFSLWQYENPRVLYYHTFSVMSNILIGAIFAQSFFKQSNWLMALANLKRPIIIGLYALGIGLILLKNKIFIGPLAAFEHTVLSIFFAFVIFDQIYLKHSFIKFGRLPFFTHLGKISYGLYLYHLVVFYILTKVITIFIYHFYTGDTTIYYWALILFFTFGTLLTYLIARLSYSYFEKPFLNLKKRFY